MQRPGFMLSVLLCVLAVQTVMLFSNRFVPLAHVSSSTHACNLLSSPDRHTDSSFPWSARSSQFSSASPILSSISSSSSSSSSSSFWAAKRDECSASVLVREGGYNSRLPVTVMSDANMFRRFPSLHVYRSEAPSPAELWSLFPVIGAENISGEHAEYVDADYAFLNVRRTFEDLLAPIALPLSAQQSLHCFFQEEQQRFPHLLSLHPRVDCQRGRYIVIDMFRHDGLGSLLADHSSIIHLAAVLNLTMVTFVLATDHYEDNGYHQQWWLGHTHFEVSRRDWEACPASSAVQQNLLQLDDVGNMFDLGDWKPAVDHELPRVGENVMTLQARYQALIVPFMQKMNAEQQGFSLRIVWCHPTDESMLLSNLITEIRFHVLHPYLPALSGSPPNAHYSLTLPAAFTLNSPSLFTSVFGKPPRRNDLLVAIHIRRGDVVRIHYPDSDQGDAATNRRIDQLVAEKSTQTGVAASDTPLLSVRRKVWPRLLVVHKYAAWIIPDHVYIRLLNETHYSLPSHLQRRMHYTIYSEGEPDAFVHLQAELKQLGIDTSIFLNSPTSSTLEMISKADIVFAAASSFSCAAALFNSASVKIWTPICRHRFRFARNSIQTEWRTQHDHITAFNLAGADFPLVRMEDLQVTWRVSNLTDYIAAIQERASEKDEQFLYKPMHKPSFLRNHDIARYPSEKYYFPL